MVRCTFANCHIHTTLPTLYKVTENTVESKMPRPMCGENIHDSYLVALNILTAQTDDARACGGHQAPSKQT